MNNMSIRHKFENTHKTFDKDWPTDFSTKNAILSTTPYKPEVIFIGTFNHGWTWNDSDFYYGRDMYMWPIMANLFLHGQNTLTRARNSRMNIPNLNEIFKICRTGKLCFADVVLGTSKHINVEINLANHTALVNGAAGKIWNSYSDSQLNSMGTLGWLDDNVKNIIAFIKSTPSIKHIYFTYNSLPWLLSLKKQIIEELPDKSSCSIFTPTGMGFRQLIPHPFNTKASSIAHCWVWNGYDHHLPVNKKNYGHLNHDWLQKNGANPQNF